MRYRRLGSVSARQCDSPTGNANFASTHRQHICIRHSLRRPPHRSGVDRRHDVHPCLPEQISSTRRLPCPHEVVRRRTFRRGVHHFQAYTSRHMASEGTLKQNSWSWRRPEGHYTDAVGSNQRRQEARGEQGQRILQEVWERRGEERGSVVEQEAEGGLGRGWSRGGEGSLGRRIGRIPGRRRRRSHKPTVSSFQDARRLRRYKSETITTRANVDVARISANKAATQTRAPRKS